MKVIFLDIDGVLNNKKLQQNRYSTILHTHIERLNTAIKLTKAKIVISSSWRYMILEKSMTKRGFENLLRTYGFIGKVIGHTTSDEKISSRGLQILEWMGKHRNINKYVVLDDEDDRITEFNHPFIKIDGSIGLTGRDVDRIVETLNEFK